MTEVCRYRPSHDRYPAYARVWFNDRPDGEPLTVCRRCSRHVLEWMRQGTANAAGQYPVAHYPIEETRP
jgi:hypothetical protein